LALERLRWLPRPTSGPFLVANVPAYRLVAFRSAADAAPALQMSIVVGRAARTQTPLFADELSSVIFRPYWYPPPSIIRNEIVPALARDPRYLDRERMDLVAPTSDRSPTVGPTQDTLSQLRSGRLALRQQPGAHNALGLVKFVFPNDYRVYMHDTPARTLFARPRRDFSHGCIRVERPADLAAFVLAGQPGWTPDGIAAAMTGDRTIHVSVSPPIPVFIFYTTAIVRADETVEFFDDVYGLDARLERELAASAVHAVSPSTTFPSHHAKEFHAPGVAP
jgi:murein L,D-transpeptidase YcbB/YkuD